MKKAKKILKNQLMLTVQAGIMTLAISVIFCMSTMTMSVHAIGPDFSYFGIAYLAEKEARLNEKTAKPANKTITAASKVRAVEKQTSNSYDYENDISINEKKGTERKR